jgi:hypothetical protein
VDARGIADEPKEYRLRLVIYSWLFEIFKGGVCVVAPQVFELIDLGVGDLASTKLFCFTWGFDKPGQEGPVVYERRPEGWVPRRILGKGSTWLPIKDSTLEQIFN